MTKPAAWTLVPKARHSLAAVLKRKQERAADRKLRRTIERGRLRLLAQARFKKCLTRKQRKNGAKRPMKQRNPLRQRSAATAARDRRLAAVCKELMPLPENHRCWIRKLGICTGATTEFHHLVPRSVAPHLILEPTNLRPSCNACNFYVQEHPAEAYANGWLLKSSCEPKLKLDASTV